MGIWIAAFLTFGIFFFREIIYIADKVFLMKKGKFILQGTVPELTQKAVGILRRYTDR